SFPQRAADQNRVRARAPPELVRQVPLFRRSGRSRFRILVGRQDDRRRAALPRAATLVRSRRLLRMGSKARRCRIPQLTATQMVHAAPSDKGAQFRSLVAFWLGNRSASPGKNERPTGVSNAARATPKFSCRVEFARNDPRRQSRPPVHPEQLL